MHFNTNAGVATLISDCTVMEARDAAQIMPVAQPSPTPGAPNSSARASRRRTVRRTRAVVTEPSATECVGAEITEDELVVAIVSLYNDALRPYGRLIRKRLGEYAAQEGRGVVDGDLGRLRSLCESSVGVMVEPEEGGEWAALLTTRHPCFIDFYGTVDTYPEDLWASFATYLASLDGESASLPGGRYSCARALLERNLLFFSDCSLGEVCHIVELAMSQRKLLGYLDGAITPYGRSHSMVKDAAAEKCMGSGTGQRMPFATWISARSHLLDILGSAVRKGRQQVPLSTLKRLFRGRFRTELSETALGYTKLSDLLQDDRISDICSVRLLETGYAVLPKGDIAAARAAMDKEMEDAAEANDEHRSDASDSKVDSNESGQVEELPTITTPDSAALEVESIPQINVARLFERQISSEETVKADGEHSARSKWSLASAKSSASRGRLLRSVVQNTFIHAVASPSETPPVTPRRSRSQPRSLGSDLPGSWSAPCASVGLPLRVLEAQSSLSRSDLPSPRNAPTPLRTPRRPQPSPRLQCVPEVQTPECNSPDARSRPTGTLEDAATVPEPCFQPVGRMESFSSAIPALKLLVDRQASFDTFEPVKSGLDRPPSVDGSVGNLTGRSTASTRSKMGLPSPCLTASPMYDWIPRGISIHSVPENESLGGSALEVPVYHIGHAYDNPNVFGEQASRFTFCPDEVLCHDNLDTCDKRFGDQLVWHVRNPLCADYSAAPTHSTPRSKWFTSSPSSLAKDGYIHSIVQNTFIHSVEQPPTPRPGMVRRSRSLPKDMGSDKILSAWEATCHAVGFLPVAVPAATAKIDPSNEPWQVVLPSPAVTCSDWGTPRALGQDVDFDPSKQVINLSDFV